jgi:hypothetical protein
MLDAHVGIRLAMSLQAAVVLAALELLDLQLNRGMLQHPSDHAHALQAWLADLHLVARYHQQDAVELDAATLGTVTAIVDPNHLPLTDAVLS